MSSSDEIPERVSVRLGEDLAADLDAIAKQGPYRNRSELIREAIRNHLQEDPWESIPERSR